MEPLNPREFKSILFFTGAGMSAESGVPTYRGRGGIWDRYNWEDYACQAAFDLDPKKVLAFHSRRREAVRKCRPHAGHLLITRLQNKHPKITIITQNIDGLHQKAGAENVIELHGSLWRIRCDHCSIRKQALEDRYFGKSCDCGRLFRPDIVWFGDSLDPKVIDDALSAVRDCDLFVSIGTSGSVWPAAGFPAEAKRSGAYGIEINLERTDLSGLFDETILGQAGTLLPEIFQS